MQGAHCILAARATKSLIPFRHAPPNRVGGAAVMIFGGTEVDDAVATAGSSTMSSCLKDAIVAKNRSARFPASCTDDAPGTVEAKARRPAVPVTAWR